MLENVMKPYHQKKKKSSDTWFDNLWITFVSLYILWGMKQIFKLGNVQKGKGRASF